MENNIRLQPENIKNRHACSYCAASQLCLPMGLGHEDLLKLETIVKQRRTIKRGEHLFQQGDKFESFYAIRDGSFKSYTLSEDGREQIFSFYILGELIGFNAVDTGQYAYSTQALESSTVCEIPFDKLLKVASEMPRLQRQIINLMSQRLKNDAGIPKNSSANERLAAFLLNITARFHRKSPALYDFYLPMSRQEIGSYLGLALETVSRLFTQLQKEQIVQVQGKRIQVSDYRRLQIIARHCPTQAS